MTSNYWQGFWRLADPKISLASFAGMFLAACLAAADHGLSLGWLAMTVLGVFCVEVGKNASGELVDYDSGTDLSIALADRSPFSGGKRVLVDALLSRAQTRTLALGFFLAAVVVGLVIVFWRDTRVLSFGLLGIALAWYYHGDPLRLSYRGLGEIAVALAYGPLVVCGTYLVQAGHLSAPLLHTSITLGLLVAAFLWINELPDYLADRQASKNNLVVRLGLQPAMFGYVLLISCGYIWLLLTVYFYPQARGLLGGMAGAFPAFYSAWRLLQSEGVTARVIPAQVACLASFMLMAVGAGLGYLLTAAW